MDEMPVEVPTEGGTSKRQAIFMIGKENGRFRIITGNYLLTENADGLKDRIDRINGMTRDELKEYYKEVLNNGMMSEKGGGGLGMIDIARKSGGKLDYDFMPVKPPYSFFTLYVNVAES